MGRKLFHGGVQVHELCRWVGEAQNAIIVSETKANACMAPSCMQILVNVNLQVVATSVTGWAIIRKPAACHAKMGGRSMLYSAFATVVSTRTQSLITGRATTAQRHHRLSNTSAKNHADP